MHSFLLAWLLVRLYQLSRWLGRRATHWQQWLRQASLAYAIRQYRPQWPDAAKPVKPWQERLKEAEEAGEPIAAVRHRRPLPDDVHCPNCGAPKEYLYNFGYEHGHAGEEAFHKIRCKLCGFQTVPNRPKRSPRFLCPYCGHALDKVKERKDFDVYRCRHQQCPYRHDVRLRAAAIHAGASPRAKTYHFRAFHLDLEQLQLSQPIKPKVDFAQIRHATTTVALALTLHIQMGLSLRETAHWLRELFGVPLSHQTVANWTESMAFLLAPLAQTRSDATLLVGDETYIRIAGQNAYWYVSYDPIQARIVVQQVALNRDTQASATLIHATMEHAPRLEAFISDDFKPYAVAFGFLAEQIGEVPGHIIVKGLQSRGVPQDAFLPYKDLLERFFRTFKQRYRRTLGFDSLNGAVAFCTLFTVYYHYFRPHTRLHGETPLALLQGHNVLQNWQQLIQQAINAA